MCKNNQTSVEMKSRIVAANSKCSAVTKLLTSRLVKSTFKLRIRPVVTYGSEIRTLANKDENDEKILVKNRKAYDPIKTMEYKEAIRTSNSVCRFQMRA